MCFIRGKNKKDCSATSELKFSSKEACLGVGNKLPGTGFGDDR